MVTEVKDVLNFLCLMYFGVLAFLFLLVILKEVRGYLKRRKKPKLILIQGEKKEKGPYTDL